MADDTIDLARLGQAVVRRRTGLGWSTHRLAVKARLADPYLRRVEAGDGARVGLDVLVRIAGALGTTADALLAESGVPTSMGRHSEFTDLYAALDEVTRPAWLRMGRTLKGIQAEYAALQRGEEDMGDIAAFSEPDLAQSMYEDAQTGEENQDPEGDA